MVQEKGWVEMEIRCCFHAANKGGNTKVLNAWDGMGWDGMDGMEWDRM